MLRLLLAAALPFAFALSALPAAAQGFNFQCSVESASGDVVLTYAAPNTRQGVADAGSFCTQMIELYGLSPTTKYVNASTTRGFTAICAAGFGSDGIAVWARDAAPDEAFALCDAMIADGRYPVRYL